MQNATFSFKYSKICNTEFETNLFSNLTYVQLKQDI